MYNAMAMFSPKVKFQGRRLKVGFAIVEDAW